jgi:hypothetical protein
LQAFAVSAKEASSVAAERALLRAKEAQPHLEAFAASALEASRSAAVRGVSGLKANCEQALQHMRERSLADGGPSDSEPDSDTDAEAADSVEKCACGSVFLPDALFCRRCGQPRHQGQQENAREIAGAGLELAQILEQRRRRAEATIARSAHAPARSNQPLQPPPPGVTTLHPLANRFPVAPLGTMPPIALSVPYGPGAAILQTPRPSAHAVWNTAPGMHASPAMTAYPAMASPVLAGRTVRL